MIKHVLRACLSGEQIESALREPQIELLAIHCQFMMKAINYIILNKYMYVVYLNVDRPVA